MSDSSDNEFSAEAELTRLQKLMASYLAQKLTFSLFEPGRYDELKERIRELVNEKLGQDGTPLDESTKEQLVAKIIAGMPVKAGDDIQPQEAESPPPEKDDLTFPLSDLQAIVKPYLASRLNDDLFQPDRKKDLTAQIQKLIHQKIEEDELPVPPNQEKELIASICQTMGLTPPDIAASAVPQSAVSEAEPEPDDIESLPTRKIPAVADQTAPPAKKPIPKPTRSMLPLKALTHEIKRDLLYHLSANLQPETMASGDELQVRAEIYQLIHAYCEGHRFTLNDSDVEKIIQEILSGDALEFQL